MNTFFTNFKRSLTDKTFYKEIGEGKQSLWLWYVAWMSGIMSVILCVILAIGMYTVLIPEVQKSIAQIPADLEIVIKNGELSVNQEMPYRLELPPDEQKIGERNFIVIDTGVPATLESPAMYETMVFANKDTVIMSEDTEIKAYKIKDFPDVTFSKMEAEQFVDIAISYAWIVPLVIFIPLILFSFVTMLFMHLIAASIFWLLMKIVSRTLSYKNAFIAVMYAYTFIFILDVILTSFVFQYTLGFWLSIVPTVLIAYIMMGSKKEKEQKKEEVIV